MICRKCGNHNNVEHALKNGYESYRCKHCMSLSFIGTDGLYSYMARTEFNELKAQRDLNNNLTFTFDLEN